MTAQRILICLHDFSRGGTERIALGLARSVEPKLERDVTILCGSLEGGLRETVDRAGESRGARPAGAARTCLSRSSWAAPWAGASLYCSRT